MACRPAVMALAMAWISVGVAVKTFTSAGTPLIVRYIPSWESPLPEITAPLRRLPLVHRG
jgi:hypothetical protein